MYCIILQIQSIASPQIDEGENSSSSTSVSPVLNLNQTETIKEVRNDSVAMSETSPLTSTTSDELCTSSSSPLNNRSDSFNSLENNEDDYTVFLPQEPAVNFVFPSEENSSRPMDLPGMSFHNRIYMV